MRKSLGAHFSDLRSLSGSAQRAVRLLRKALQLKAFDVGRRRDIQMFHDMPFMSVAAGFHDLPRKKLWVRETRLMAAGHLDQTT